MLLLKLLATLLAVATVALTAPVHTDQLTEQSVGSPNANSAIIKVGGQGKHHALKLKDSIHHSYSHNHRQQKHKHVHNKVEVDEYPGSNEEEENDLHKRAPTIWSKFKAAVGFGGSSKKSGGGSSKPPNRLTKPAPGVAKTNKASRTEGRILLHDEFKPGPPHRSNSLPVAGRRPPVRSNTI